MGALATTWKQKYKQGFEPLAGGVEFVEYGDADAMREAIDDERPPVMILDPSRAKAGSTPPPPSTCRRSGRRRKRRGPRWSSTRSRPGSAVPDRCGRPRSTTSSRTCSRLRRARQRAPDRRDAVSRLGRRGRRESRFDVLGRARRLRGRRSDPRRDRTRGPPRARRRDGGVHPRTDRRAPRRRRSRRAGRRPDDRHRGEARLEPAAARLGDQPPGARAAGGPHRVAPAPAADDRASASTPTP